MARSLKACVLKELGRLDEAIRVVREVVALNDEDGCAGTCLASLLMNNDGGTEEAERLLRRAVKLQAKERYAYIYLGRILEATDREAEAEAVYREGIRIDPHFAWLYTDLGDLFLGQGRYDEAIEQLQKSIRLFPTNNSAHGKLISTLRKQGRLDKALEAGRIAITRLPDWPEFHYQLGRVFEELERPAEAIVAYRQELELSPNHSDARRHLSLLLGAKGLEGLEAEIK